MSYQILYSDTYIRRVKKFFLKHPDLEKPYQKILRLLEENPNHPSLRLHALHGRLQGLFSISINLKFRITLQLLIQKDTLILIDIGSHDEVYR